MVNKRLFVLNINLFKISIYGIILFAAIPAIDSYVPELIQYVFLALFFFCIIYKALTRSELIKSTIIILSASIFLGILLYYGKWKGTLDIYRCIYSNIKIWIPLIAGIQLDRYSSKEKMKMLHFYFVLELFSVLTSINGLLQYPNAARMLALVDSNYLSFNRMNIGGYAFIYSAVLLLPILAFAIKTCKHKVLYVFSFIANLYMIFLSQYTIAIIMSVICMLAIFMFNRNKTANIILIFLLIVFIVLTLAGDFVEQLLVFISAALPDGFLLDRIQEIILFIQGGNWSGDSLSRAKLYTASLLCFFNNPFFGASMSGGEVGGHSEILDILGATGIIGFICLVNCVKPYFKKIKNFSRAKSLRFIEITIGVWVLISFLNTSAFFQMFLVVMLLPFLILEDKNENINCE